MCKSVNLKIMLKTIKVYESDWEILHQLKRASKRNKVADVISDLLVTTKKEKKQDGKGFENINK